MKIALVYHDLNIGGGTYQLLSFANELSKNHEVIVFAHTDSTGSLYKNLKLAISIKILYQNKKNPKANKISILFSPIINAINMARLILKYNFDVINAYDIFTQWPAAIVKYVKKTPVVWTCFDLWHVPGMEETKEKRIIFKLFNQTVRWWIDLFFTRQVDSVVVLDYKMQRKFFEKYGKEPIVVRSGIDNSRFSHNYTLENAKRMLHFENKFVFLCFSIFSPHRRFEDAINAFIPIAKKPANAILVIIGSDLFDPSYSNMIKRAADNTNLQDRIIFDTNFLPEKKLEAYLSASDVFVYPNERQTWGLAVIEEMFLGKPCVVSSDTGVAEIIKNGENGLIFKSKNTNELSALMDRLYKSPKLRKNIGAEARRFVRSSLSWRKHTQQMINVFNKVKK